MYKLKGLKLFFFSQTTKTRSKYRQPVTVQPY